MLESFWIRLSIHSMWFHGRLRVHAGYKQSVELVTDRVNQPISEVVLKLDIPNVPDTRIKGRACDL